MISDLNFGDQSFNDSVWLTSKRVFELYSIRRQSLYRLLKDKKIISKCNKPFGAKKGSRYWLKESIDRYFESLGDGVDSFLDEKYTYSNIEMTIFPVIEFKMPLRFQKIVIQ
jgi:hypothetical protein